MWTPEHRRAANRHHLRYPSDLTDDEWAVIAPLIPPARHGGGKRSVNVREVLNGISTWQIQVDRKRQEGLLKLAWAPIKNAKINGYKCAATKR
jgi:hypothetical protein